MDTQSPIETRSRLNTTSVERTTDRYGRVISEQEGVRINQTSMVKTASGDLITFHTPSVCALALHEAIQAGRTASLHRQILSEQSVNSPHGHATHIGDDTQVSDLFDCIQKSMVCVTFSYVALEVYCNEELSLDENKLIEHEVSGRDGKKKVKKPAKHWEERASTEDKFGIILPEHVGVPTPKGMKIWEDFRSLQKARNEIVHPKSILTNPRVKSLGDIPKASVFYRFLSDDVLMYPRAAVRIILHFATHRHIPSWMVEPMSLLGIASPSDLSSS